ncbi:MAG TPA: hemerythrin domain-containing protein [Thermoanaerobaculia bacterium]
MEARFSLYRDIHKGVRTLLMDLTTKAGRVDFTDAAAVATFRAELRSTLGLLTSHAEHENEFVGAALRQYAPDVEQALGGEHEEQEHWFHELVSAADAIDAGAKDARVKGHALVVKLSRVAGELLTHMADEEEIAMPALWRVLDDPALIAIEQRLLASVPPDEMGRWLSLMLPSMNTPERVEMFLGMQAGAPPEVFHGVRALAKQVLSPADDAALEAGLSVAV